MTWPQKNKLIYVTSLKTIIILDTTHIVTTYIILKLIYEINLLCNISYFCLHVNVSSVSKKNVLVICGGMRRPGRSLSVESRC